MVHLDQLEGLSSDLSAPTGQGDESTGDDKNDGRKSDNEMQGTLKQLTSYEVGSVVRALYG